MLDFVLHITGGGERERIMNNYFDRYQVADIFGARDWQRVLFKEFESTLLSEARPFPCVFGVTGFKTNQLRFAFPDPWSAANIACALAQYLVHAPKFGRNTSLVVIARPGPVKSLEAYRRTFWSTLRERAEIDRHPWPADIPEAIDSPLWEFSFAGEPIFVVCNTPAHVMRQSRRATSFMMTFQPRWVFDNMVTNPAGERAYVKVRERLASFDLLPASPALGRYGDQENREFAQYFLSDENEPAKCPFHSLATKKEQAA